MTFNFTQSESESESEYKIEAIINTQVVGSISLENEDGRTQVWDTEVLEGNQNKGIATKMYNQLKNELSTIGVDSFYSDAEFSSCAIQKIYDKIGGELVDVEDDRRYKVEL